MVGTGRVVSDPLDSASVVDAASVAVEWITKACIVVGIVDDDMVISVVAYEMISFLRFVADMRTRKAVSLFFLSRWQ